MNIGILSEEKNNRYLITPETAKLIIEGGNNVFFTTEIEREYNNQIIRIKSSNFNQKEKEEIKKIFLFIKKNLIESNTFSTSEYNIIESKIQARIKKLCRDKTLTNYKVVKDIYVDFYKKVAGYNFLLSGAFRLKSNEEIIKKCTYLTCYIINSKDIELLDHNHTLICYSNALRNKNKIDKISSKKSNLIGIEYIKDQNGKSVIKEIISNLSARVGLNMIMSILNRQGIILGNTPFNDKSRITIFGYGFIGKEIARLFKNFDCDITIFDKNSMILGDDNSYSFFSINNEEKLKESIEKSDIIISAIGNKFKPCKKIFKEEYINLIKKETLLFDFSINQGGIIEGAKETKQRDHISEFYTANKLNNNLLYSGVGDILQFTNLSLSNYISNILVFYLVFILENKAENLEFFENAFVIKKGFVNNDFEFIESKNQVIPDIEDPFDLMDTEVSEAWKNMDDVNELLEANSNYEA
jgi:alanine dehydrogenase